MGRLKTVYTTLIFIVSTYQISFGQYYNNQFARLYEVYQEHAPQVNLNFVFNQPKYSPGDTVWFKVYLLYENKIKVSGQQLLSIRVTGCNQDIIVAKNILIDNGIGHDYFWIPDSIKSGLYTFQAYHAWMKNFTPVQQFQRQLVVTNEHRINLTQSDTIIIAPEGGQLIAGVKTKIGIYTGNKDELIHLKDQSGTILDSTFTDAYGTGLFQLLPGRQNTEVYTIQSNSHGQQSSVQSSFLGYALHTEIDSATNEMNVQIQAGSHQPEEKLNLLVSAEGKIWHSSMITVSSHQFASIKIPIEKLPSGLVTLSILKKSGELQATRQRWIPVINRPNIAITSQKTNYSPRENIELEMALTDQRGQPVKGEFSIRTLVKSLFDDSISTNKSPFLNVAGKTNFMDPFSQIENAQSVDQYLIAMAESLPWEKILSKNTVLLDQILSKTPTKLKNLMSESIIQPKYDLSEKITKYGTVILTDTKAPLPKSASLFFYLQKAKTVFQSTIVDDLGNFKLSILPTKTDDELLYLSTFDGELLTDIEISWLEDELTIPDCLDFSISEQPDVYGHHSLKKRLIEDAYAINDQIITTQLQTAMESKAEVMEVDARFYMDEYITFTSMHELIKEVIGQVSITKKSKKDAIRMKIYPMVSYGDPLYIIDGIATKNTDFFLSITPSTIKKIELINDHRKLVRYGPFGQNGIIVVQTLKGNYREKPKNQNDHIPGLHPKRNFSSDTLIPGDHTISNFNSTVYWNPIVQTDENGKAKISFQAGDYIGALQVTIEGSAENLFFKNSIQLVITP